mgnify:CR=1 FL=1
MPIPSVIVRKTKQEVLEEYQKLKEQFDELQAISGSAYRAENREILSKAKEQLGGVTQSVSELKKSVGESFDSAFNQLSGNLDTLLAAILEQANKFNELEQAIELSKNHLKINHGVEVAAETLENLMGEYEKKKKEFEEYAKEQKELMGAEIIAAKRNWQREEEEYQYSFDLKRKREQALFEEEKLKKEQQLAAREGELKNREMESDKLRKEAEKFPNLLNSELQAREKEVARCLNDEWEQKAALLKKDWESEKRFYEMQIKNLEDQIKKQEAETGILKKEAEAANKKAQELAVKVIESGARNRSEGATPERGLV